MEKGDNFKTNLYILGILFVVLIVLIVIAYTKDCGSDRECFDKGLNKCSKVKGEFVKGDSFMKYEVIGKRNDKCILRVTMLESSSEPNIKKVLVGKGMVCEFSLDMLKDTSVVEIDNLESYCSGPLKEALLKMNVDRLYSFIINNLGEGVAKNLEGTSL